MTAALIARSAGRPTESLMRRYGPHALNLDVTRRCLSGMALATWLAPAAGADVSRPSKPNLIALDWGIAETLVALKHPPVGAAEIWNYNRSVVAPRMPEGVTDVGLRLSPNAELMSSLHPDLVLINAAQTYMRASLSAFGSVDIVSIYTAAGQPYQLSCSAARTMAQLVGDQPAAAQLLDRAAAVMTETRQRLKEYDGRPLYMVQFIDAVHLMVCGRTSLFQGVLDQLGLKNAWSRRAGPWGTATVSIEALLESQDARLLYMEPVPEDARRTLEESPLWQRLPCVREHRVMSVPSFWPFGALPSAMRIAQLLGDTLVSTPVAHG